MHFTYSEHKSAGLLSRTLYLTGLIMRKGGGTAGSVPSDSVASIKGIELQAGECVAISPDIP